MATLTELRLELDDATTMKLIAGAFTEASAARIQKIKSKFEENKQFYAEIIHVYHLVRQAKKEQVSESVKGKRLMVAFTSNQRFYGNLNINIMTKFIEETKKAPDNDVLVVGSTGRDYIKSVSYTHPYTTKVFEKDMPNREETVSFLESIKSYSTVTVYYPKFVSLVSQTVGVMDICAADNDGEEIKQDELSILFEPEYSRIVDFFSRQVRALLWVRVVLETDLSRTAARLLTMSSAEERSTELIKINRRSLKKILNAIVNNKLLETFTAIQAVQGAK